MYIGSKSILQEKYRWILIVLAAFPLFLVAGFRYGIGSDYFSYVDIFRTSSGEYDGIEPLYYLLNHFLNKMGFGEQWIFIVCSAIYVLAIFKYVYKESPNPIFSIYLFVSMTFYVSFFNTMRQNLACAILLYAIPYVRKKKIIPFLIIVTIAGLIHYSSFVFILVYLFAYIRITPPKMIIIIAGFLVFRSFFSQKIVNIVMDNQHYVKYLNDMSNIAGYSVQNVLGILVQLAILVVSFIGYKKDDEKYRIYCSIQLMALLFIMLGDVVPLINRVKWIFSYQSIILLPYVINYYSVKNRQLIKFGTGIAFAIYFYVVIVDAHAFDVLPYKSIFNK